MKKLLLGTALLALTFSGGAAFAETSAHSSDTAAAHGDSAMHHDIVATATEAGDFSTLLAAAKAAGLVEALQAEGPMTVFAPTDAAFAALPAGTVDDLLKPENKEKLANIIKYHVVSGKIMSSDIAHGTTEVDTMEGDKAEVMSGADGVTIDGAHVVKADIAASNGVIHVIDKVIMPN